MTAYLWIALGGALGSVARYWASGVVAQKTGDGFPWGTLLVNVSGSLAIGFIATLTAPEGRWAASPAVRQFLMVGILGGFTTFSAFSLQTLELAQRGEWASAGWNVVASVVICLIAVWLGHVAAMGLNTVKG
jgi:CrcB protein